MPVSSAKICEGADMLIISDFLWGRIFKENIDLIEKARNGGMKFYGVGIDIRPHRLDAPDDPSEIRDGYAFLKQCDYRYLYENGSVIEHVEKPSVL